MSSSYRARTLLHVLLGVASSTWLHLMAATTLVLVVIFGWLSFTLPTPAMQTIVMRRSTEPIEATLTLAEVPVDIDDRRHDLQPVDAAELEAKLSDPRWQALVEPAEQLQERESAGIQLHDELLRIAADVQRHSLDENLERLEGLSKKLTAVSSEQGVSDVSTQINKLLGTEARADKPTDDVASGEFDFDTAQLHDVQRERDADGKWKYTAVLLDAQGRTFASPLSPEEGESTYRTMQLIKSNPLLERVYRGVVMSLLDKVMKSQ